VLFFGGFGLVGLGCYLRTRIDEVLVVDRSRRLLLVQRRAPGSTTERPVASFDMVRGVGIVGQRGPRHQPPASRFWVEATLRGGSRLALTDRFVLDGWQPDRDNPSHPVLSDLRRKSAIVTRMIGLEPSPLRVLGERCERPLSSPTRGLTWKNGCGAGEGLLD
jgi:hypothetical protein